MKPLKAFLMTILVLSTVIPELSCTRKGEDDPILSLRTRKNRIVGKWKIVSGNARLDFVEPLRTPALYSYDGTTETMFSAYDGQVTGTTLFTCDVEFNRDNSFVWTMNWKDNFGSTYQGELKGEWDFADKSDNRKKKVDLVLTPSSNTGQWPFSSANAFPARQLNPVFQITSLTNNRIVIERNIVLATPNLLNPGILISPYYEEWTLEPR
ncbi:MAG: hypothetical protein MUC87_10460 [Bacteroidia bacterium]|jgi:hypothetical protein|nr:hypothetical protein [Bacteroidia bacterium]